MVTLRRLLMVAALVSIVLPSLAQPAVDLSYYLPKGPYDPAIPTPHAVLGFDVGQWHLSHDQVVRYCYALAAASDRVTIEEYGRTYEGRPQLLLTISSAANQARIEEIRRAHLALSDPNQNTTVNGQPVVVYMGFSVHGNEPSGGNASVLMAYYLAASQAPEVLAQLAHAVVLIDPVFNPDGFQRFSTWANSNRALTETTDPASREFNETWPGGRTNHYWFDLNRQWLPAQQPEAQHRLPVYHRWKPNVLTDHHEMGTNSTFFFQPGIPSRNNPLTPENTYTLTEQLARYHAAYLDSLGSLYYSQESFDDFFYGKGSTYPDINGGVGILFEQGSSRGHAQESRFGVLRFPFTIRNQFTTARSTLAGSVALRENLLSHQQQFYKSALEAAAADAVQAYAFGGNDPGTQARARALAEVLRLHQIELYTASGNVPGFSDGALVYVAKANQPQYRLLKAMFERRTQFTDSLFYDVSAWTLPLAFGVPDKALSARALASLRLTEVGATAGSEGFGLPATLPYAFAFDWRAEHAAAFTHQLLNAGLVVETLTEGIQTEKGYLGAGTVLLPTANQPIGTEALQTLLGSLLAKYKVPYTALATGYNPDGAELGSRTIESLTQPKVAILVGKGVSGYDAGEVWHLLDQRLHMPATLLELGEVSQVDLARYTHIVLVNGRYNGLESRGESALQAWVEAGGTLIATAGGVNQVLRMNLGAFLRRTAETSAPTNPTYASRDRDRGSRYLGGAIFEARVDTTHPLFFGFSTDRVALFRNHSTYLQVGSNPYSTPATYTQSPLVAGYCHPDALKGMAGSAAVQVSRAGRGRVIVLADNPVFRAFWRGSERILVNALFFAPVISLTTAE